MNQDQVKDLLKRAEKARESLSVAPSGITHVARRELDEIIRVLADEVTQ
jgi:hypothetical protein